MSEQGKEVHVDPRFTTMAIQLTRVEGGMERLADQIAQLVRATESLTTIDKQVSEHSGALERLEKDIRAASDVADGAASAILVSDTAHKASLRTLLVVFSLVGGMATAGSIWLISTVVDSKERLAVIEHQGNIKNGN